MQTYNNDTQFKFNAVYTLIDDEAVLLGESGEDLYGANPMAAKIVQMLEDKPMSISLISQHILEHYSVSASECLVDLQEMFTMLFHAKLISISPA